MTRQIWRRSNTPQMTIGIIALIGLLGMFLSVVVPNAYTRIIPTFVLIGSAVGAVGYRHGVRLKQPIISRGLIPARGQIAYLAIYLGLVGGLMALYLDYGGKRPLSVHILTITLFGFVALAPFVFDSVVLGLPLLLGAGIVHRATIYFVGVVPIGNDALFHLRVSSEIITSGSLEPLLLSKYWYAPLYHLMVSLTAVALNLPVRETAFLIITIPSTIVPPLVIFGLLRRYWSDVIGYLGALMFIVSDHAILTSVHVTPTSLGLAFFAVILWSGDRFIQGSGRSALAMYICGLVALTITHQLSMFISLVMVGTFLATTAAIRGGLRSRETLLGVLLFTAFVLQSMATRYNGPAGEEGSFLMTVAPSIIQSFIGGITGGGRTAAYPPPSANVAVSGADAVTVVQVLGMGLLFGAAVIGIILWMSHRTSGPTRQGLAVTAMVTVATGIVFGPPTLGVNVFIPGRWFPFIYVGLAILAAPGVSLIIAKVTSVNRQPVVSALVVLILAVSLTGVMTLNAYGAPDDPVLDEAPAAGRISTTNVEADAFKFVLRRNDETRIVTDFGAWRVMERHYEEPVSVYRTQYGAPDTTFEGSQLLVYREYAKTDHASYYLLHQGREFRVYGPLPNPPETTSIVFDNGEVRVYYLEG